MSCPAEKKSGLLDRPARNLVTTVTKLPIPIQNKPYTSKYN